MDLYDFITLVFDEAERQCHDNLWCNLTKEEQIELFCEQFEHQLKTNWKEVSEVKRYERI